MAQFESKFGIGDMITCRAGNHFMDATIWSVEFMAEGVKYHVERYEDGKGWVEDYWSIMECDLLDKATKG